MQDRHQDDKQALIKRLSRISGQVQGIGRMIEEDRYCIDILNQMQAIKAALSKVEDAIIDDHASCCVEDAIKSGNVDEQRQKFGELVALMNRVKR